MSRREQTGWVLKNEHRRNDRTCCTEGPAADMHASVASGESAEWFPGAAVTLAGLWAGRGQ